MAEIVYFSEDQAFGYRRHAQHRVDRPGAKGAQSLPGKRITIRRVGISFAGNGLLQVVLQWSLNGSSWNDHGAPLTPAMGFSTALALQVLARRNLLALGEARYLLVYRISGAVPTGDISATLETAPKDRFGYGSSGFAVA